MILFGVRPCDLNATSLMDEAFADSNGDPNYLEKREKTFEIWFFHMINDYLYDMYVIA